MLRRVLLFGVLFMTGCSNPYKDFYHSITSPAENPRLVAHSGEPEIRSGTADAEADIRRMREDNYRMIGYSSFTAGSVDRDQAVQVGKELGAAVVLHYSKYSHTRSGVMPFTVPQTTTSYHSGTVNVPGGGSARYSGTTTNYGTTTTFIPYSVDRYDYSASYWVKTQRGGLGIYAEDTTPRQKQEIGGNRGVVITAVKKGSSAYRADVVAGDILIKIGDDIIRDKPALFEIAPTYYGRSGVPLVFFRNGEFITLVADIDEGFVN